MDATKEYLCTLARALMANHQRWSVSYLAVHLNACGFRTQAGSQYAVRGRGIYSLLRATWKAAVDEDRRADCWAIEVVFPTSSGIYAYDPDGDRVRELDEAHHTWPIQDLGGAHQGNGGGPITTGRPRPHRDDAFIRDVVNGGGMPLREAAEKCGQSLDATRNVIKWCRENRLGKARYAFLRPLPEQVQDMKAEDMVEIEARPGWRDAFLSARGWL
jgi:hypothetical protein